MGDLHQARARQAGGAVRPLGPARAQPLSAAFDNDLARQHGRCPAPPPRRSLRQDAGSSGDRGRFGPPDGRPKDKPLRRRNLGCLRIGPRAEWCVSRRRDTPRVR